LRYKRLGRSVSRILHLFKAIPKNEHNFVAQLSAGRKQRHSVFTSRKALFLLSILLLTACVPSVQEPLAVHTSNPVQAFVDANASQATAQAAVATAQFYTGQLTATVEAQHAIATERAWLVQSTQQAAEIASTARAWEATTTADSLASANQSTATQHALNITATTDAASASTYATAMAGEAISVELAIQRQRMMNKMWAVTPWAVLLATLVFLIFLVLRWIQVRPIQRDPRGDAPLLIIGGKVYDADRNPYPLLDISSKSPQIPALTSPELQEVTTARDQMIDLATRGALDSPDPERRKSAARQLTDQSLPALSKVDILPPEQASPWIKDVLPGIVKDAIEADVLNTDEGEIG